MAASLLAVAEGVLAVLKWGLRKDVSHAWTAYCGWLFVAPLLLLVFFLGREAAIVFVTIVAILGFHEFARATGLYHDGIITGAVYLGISATGVLIANHASHLDTLCLLSALPISRLHRAFPVTARDYFCISAPRALVAAVVVNALPFDRHFAPWQSLSVYAHLLDKPGTILIFFPEGTRSGGFEPGEFKPGVGLLAAGRDLPVVPCHLAGTHAALPKGAWCPRPKAVQLTIGAPRIYAHLPATKESAKQICRELREAVMVLGNAEPEEYLAGRERRESVLAVLLGAWGLQQTRPELSEEKLPLPLPLGG